MFVNEDIKHIFGNNYYTIIRNYISTIQKIIDTHDIVVFMARKAYCFYKALLVCGLVTKNSNCLILSSRAVTYNGIDFLNKKIAIVEDVVIQGESLNEVIKEGNFTEYNLDIYMLACSEEYISKVQGDNSQHKYYSSCIIDENDLLELATLITNYIVYEMIPYNSDYPIYQTEFSDNKELESIFNRFYSISDLVHCNNEYVREGIININESIFNHLFQNNKEYDIICKIRVYINYANQICYLVPIVIFPRISRSILEESFNTLFLSEYNGIVTRDNDNLTQKNRLRILCYKLSDYLMVIFKKSFENLQINKISEEIELFSCELFNIKNKTSNLLINNIIKYAAVNKDLLYNSLGYAYDLLIKNFNLNNDSNFVSDYISFDDIKQRISIVETDCNTIIFVSSLILDVFIDNGVIVPRVKYDNKSIYRVFKFGEVAKLTEHDFILFTMVLGEYSDLVKRLLDKTELEKISVIFFKNYNNSFNTESNEAEAFRICYSKFGPRISSSRNQYIVPQGQALTDVLEKNGLLELKGDNKYNVISISQNEEYNKVNGYLRNLFASKLYKLYVYYNKASKYQPNNEIFIYINSFNRLLTLLSIGDNEQDQLLSLIAEVYLVKSNSLYKYYSDINYMMYRFDRIIDGILSGVWKYFCFKNEKLLDDAFTLLYSESGEQNALYAIDIFLKCLTNKKNNQMEFVSEIGEFLYDISIFYKFLCDYYNKKIHDDFSKSPYKHFLSKRYFDNIHNEYVDISKKPSEEVNAFIISHLNDIELKSSDIIDRYHIYEKSSNLNYEVYSECLIVFNINKEQHVINKYKKYFAFENDELLIFPINKGNKKSLISDICLSLDDVNTKVLYYSSTNENILLYLSTNGSFGYKFMEDVKKAIEFIRENLCPISAREILVLPKLNFETKEFHNVGMRYEFIDKYDYNKRTLYRYSFDKVQEIKEDKKVEITNLTVFGNMYNFEEISGDLNLLASKCLDAETQQYIDDAKEALDNGNTSKFESCIKWLGDNAKELIKSIGPTVLIELIKSGKI